MAEILLHGTLHATILEADKLSNPERASAGAPKFLRKVFHFTSCYLFLSFVREDWDFETNLRF